jgi:Ca2+/Na+ antiporter
MDNKRIHWHAFGGHDPQRYVRVNAMNPQLIGELITGAIWLAILVPWNYYNIKKINGPKERSFAIKFSISMLSNLVVWSVLFHLLRSPHRWYVCFLYALAILIMMILCGKKQTKLREEESVQSINT